VYDENTVSLSQVNKTGLAVAFSPGKYQYTLSASRNYAYVFGARFCPV